MRALPNYKAEENDPVHEGTWVPAVCTFLLVRETSSLKGFLSQLSQVFATWECVYVGVVLFVPLQVMFVFYV